MSDVLCLTAVSCRLGASWQGRSVLKVPTETSFDGSRRRALDWHNSLERNYSCQNPFNYLLKRWVNLSHCVAILGAFVSMLRLIP